MGLLNIQNTFNLLLILFFHLKLYKCDTFNDKFLATVIAFDGKSSSVCNGIVVSTNTVLTTTKCIKHQRDNSSYDMDLKICYDPRKCIKDPDNKKCFEVDKLFYYKSKEDEGNTGVFMNTYEELNVPEDVLLPKIKLEFSESKIVGTKGRIVTCNGKGE